MPLGPDANYLAKYNGHVLPGYVQQETMPSEMSIADHYANYADGSNSEYTGLKNKTISLRLKVWELDYQACKDQVQKAATIIRSKRGGYAPLYVQYSDRHYDALGGIIRMEHSADKSTRMVEYEVEFNCKPWLVSDTTNTITGNSLARARTTLASPTRTLDDGGWTYANVLVTGNDITISGYSSNERFTGFISISGAVTSLIINSEEYTALVGTSNKNNQMRWADYRLYVAPETTYFVVSGATNIEISYNNRWYI